jgi:orotidine-5'-phosphate decarboxylase
MIEPSQSSKNASPVDARERMIVALDVSSAEAAFGIVEELGDQVLFYKVGFELFTAAGLPFVRELRSRHKNIFLDLKVFDISETVRRTVAVVAKEGIKFLTIHGNEANIKAAAEARAGSDLKLLAVTVLTSMDADDLDKMGFGRDVKRLVLLRAGIAAEAGCDGVITSAQEAKAIKEATGGRILIVTPGIRPDGSEEQDQKRIATPRIAIENGADYLVVGRPITGAADRKAAAAAILAEMQRAFNSIVLVP